MSLRTSRNEITEAVAEGRFIQMVLEKKAKEVDVDIEKRVRQAGFRSSFWSHRNFHVNNNESEYVHLPQHRFVDMKTRQTASGIKRKKAHHIHNAVLYGHAGDMVQQLSYGFTESVKKELMDMDGTQL